MCSGADSLRVAVRFIEALSELGIPAHWFTPDGLLKLCKEIAAEAKCSLGELDQVLWHPNAVKK
jgi:hypothetical protein